MDITIKIDLSQGTLDAIASLAKTLAPAIAAPATTTSTGDTAIEPAETVAQAKKRIAAEKRAEKKKKSDEASAKLAEQPASVAAEEVELPTFTADEVRKAVRPIARQDTATAKKLFEGLPGGSVSSLDPNDQDSFRTIMSRIAELGD